MKLPCCAQTDPHTTNGSHSAWNHVEPSQLALDNPSRAVIMGRAPRSRNQVRLDSPGTADAIDRRFRLKVALEGAVAEVHFERKLKIASREGWLGSYEGHDVDGMHDFTVVTLSGTSIKVEVKTIRNGLKPQVEIQKTRAAKGDASSRYYDREHFDVVAVCVGRFTGDWSQFRYCLVKELPPHKQHPLKLQVMHGIPDVEDGNPRWFSRFQDVIDALAV